MLTPETQSSPFIFQTEHFVIRQSTLNDTQDYLTFWNDKEAMKYIGDGTWGGDETVVRKILLKNIAFYKTHPGLGFWSVEEKIKETVIGEVGFGILSETGEVEAGYLLAKAY